MNMLWKIAVILLLLAAVRLSFFTVEAGEFAYVTILGRHFDTYDGGGGEAGLYFGWPWPIEAVQRLDRRIQQFDLPATEQLTTDKNDKVDKNLTIEAYVVWRIKDKDAVSRFVQRIGTQEKVRLILAPRVISTLGALMGQRRMDDIISTRPGVIDAKMAELHESMMKALKDQVMEEYGIELIDVRLRRFNYPKETSAVIFDRIKSERQKKAEEYRAEGELQAQNIVSKADEDFRTRIAEARSEEERIKGQADADAMRIRNEAHRQDAKFYEFLKEMEKLQSILSNNRTVLLLSAQRPLFQRLFNPPLPGHENPLLKGIGNIKMEKTK